MKSFLTIILILISIQMMSQKYSFYKYEMYLSDYLSPQNSPDVNDSILKDLFSKNKYDLIHVTDSFAVKSIIFPENTYIHFYPKGQFKITDSVVYDHSHLNAGPYKIHDINDSIIFTNITYIKKHPQWFGATSNPNDSIINKLSYEKLERLLPGDDIHRKPSIKKTTSFIFDNYNVYYYCFNNGLPIRGRLPYSSDIDYYEIEYKVFNYASTPLMIWLYSGDKINGTIDATFTIGPNKGIIIHNSGQQEIGWQIGYSWALL